MRLPALFVISLFISIENISGSLPNPKPNKHQSSLFVPSSDVLRFVHRPSPFPANTSPNPTSRKNQFQQAKKNKQILNRKFPNRFRKKISKVKKQVKVKSQDVRAVREQKEAENGSGFGFGFVSNLASMFLRSISIDNAIQNLGILKTILLNYGKSQTPKTKRHGRSLSTSRDDKGIAFPSLEGALLSLAFLTFSVFLIDLVQNLLSRLRVPVRNTNNSNASSMMTTMMTTTTARDRDRGRSKPSLSSLTSLVLQAIENPWFL